LAYGVNLIRPVFQNSRSLSEITGLPVLGVVSRTNLWRYRWQRRRATLALSSAFALLLMVFGLCLVLGRHGFPTFGLAG
jgi:uncharacterized membrane protein